MATAYILKMQNEHVRRMENSKRKTLDKFVQLESGKVKLVHWKALVDAHQEFVEKASEGVEDSPWIDLLRYLEVKGTLCNNNQGFFPFSGVDLSPSDGGTKYHFTRQADATAYARAQFAKVLYPVQIARLITKKVNLTST